MSRKNLCKDCEWYRDTWCHYEPERHMQHKDSFCSKFELNYVQRDANRLAWIKWQREFYDGKGEFKPQKVTEL